MKAFFAGGEEIRRWGLAGGMLLGPSPKSAYLPPPSPPTSYPFPCLQFHFLPPPLVSSLLLSILLPPPFLFSLLPLLLFLSLPFVPLLSCLPLNEPLHFNQMSPDMTFCLNTGPEATQSGNHGLKTLKP